MMPMTHLVGAVGLTGWILGPDPLVLIAGVTGAVLPDLDELHSPLGWRLAQLLPNPAFGIGRQRTHSLVWSVFIAAVSWMIGLREELIAALWIGWASHMVLDALTGGIPLWWPWSIGPEDRVRVASWRNAGFGDYVTCVLCVVGVGLVAWQDHWVQSWAAMLQQAIVEGRGSR
ncbi:MAG: metal-dependent hydrolase [Nitrospirota bacterium]|nr:metal-dependent hydrolase [Nitrospirota bacterium]